MRSRRASLVPSRAGARAGAGEGNRTLVCSLEGCRSTIELHPQGLAVAGPEALPQLVRSLFVGHTRDRALERVLLTMGVRAFGHGLWPSDHARLGPCQTRTMPDNS